MKAQLDRARQLDLIADKPQGAIDATGFETRHVSAHYLHRTGKRTTQYTVWPKVTAICDTQTYLFWCCIVTRGPGNDCPQFAPAAIQANRFLRFDRLLGDAGFDSEPNHQLARDILGIRLTVIPINRRRSGKEGVKGHYRDQMDKRFPCQVYHQRVHIESSFSQHKRVLGSALRARSDASRERECFVKILTHNLMILYCLN